MFFRPPGRDKSQALATLGVGHVDQNTITHANQVDALFAIIFTSIDLLRPKGIAESLDCIVERDTMLALSLLSRLRRRASRIGTVTSCAFTIDTSIASAMPMATSGSK
jgi:hypothetical protein